MRDFPDINFSITNDTKSRLPRLPFADMKKRVLGTKYELSLVFVSDAKMAKLNKTYRDKNGTTDVLSFPISNTSGEMYISLTDAARQAPDFGMPARNFVGFLIIHGMLHLKGHDHGSTMEREETKFLRIFKWQKKSPSALTSERIKSKRS